jgi:hypothetical protein
VSSTQTAVEPKPHQYAGVGSLDESRPLPDLADYLKVYAKQKPHVIAYWCFGAGFLLGWKLKPW